MRIGSLLALVVFCCVLGGCGSSGSNSESTGGEVTAPGGAEERGSDGASQGGVPDGVELVGCEQAYDGVDPVAIVKFPEGTKGDGTSIPSAGWALVEIIGSSAPMSVSGEPATVTVYAGSVEPVGSEVLGATPVEVEDPEAVTGCRITNVGTNGPTPQTELEGPAEAVEGEVMAFGTEPPEEVQIAYEDSPGAA